MLFSDLLFALALLFGCERWSRTIHTASWKPGLMGTDRLVVRSAPSPGHGKNRGFPAAPQHPWLLPHRSQSCGRALEPWQLRRAGVRSASPPVPCRRLLFVRLFVALCPRRCPVPCPRRASALPARSGRGERGRGCPARSSPARSSGAAPLLEPCRATPAPAGVTCENPWMNSGLGGTPPSPQRNRGLGSTG